MFPTWYMFRHYSPPVHAQHDVRKYRGLSGAEFDWSDCSSIVPFSESQHILLSPKKEAATPNWWARQREEKEISKVCHRP